MSEAVRSQEEYGKQIEDALRSVTSAGHPVIGHFGAMEIAGQQRSWWSVRYDDAIPKLQTLPDYKVAQIFAVLGSEVRLAIMRSIVNGPRTAAELVDELGFKTTGQAYHHLRELERAGYVELKSGTYHFSLMVGRVYLTALCLASDAGAEATEEG
jgi:DNA-binding transcriptional ArsR family regulator